MSKHISRSVAKLARFRTIESALANLRRYARQSHQFGGAKTFLAIDDAGNKTILGFYSLSPASVDYARTPKNVRRGLARHDVPGFRSARLAVVLKLQGQGIGGQLLLAAGRRCLLAAAEVGGVVLVIEAALKQAAKQAHHMRRLAEASASSPQHRGVTLSGGVSAHDYRRS